MLPSVRARAMVPPMSIALDEVLAAHAVPLFDAYGVLVDAAGARPGAAAVLQRLIDAGRPFFVLTNDGSRLPVTCAARYRRVGLPIDAEQVISTAGLIPRYYDDHGLAGARTLLLGPDDARRAIEAGGGVVVDAHEAIDVVVLADEAFQPLLPRCDDALSAVARQLERGRTPRLVLANPDLIYPRGDGGFGLTAGSLAAMLEAAWALRYPEIAPRFERLGKPYAPIFEEAVRRAGTRDLVMLGDQLETDIRGANRFGIASALVLGGVSRWPTMGVDAERTPTYVVPPL